MACEAITGEPMPPMPARRGGWGIYQTFATRDHEQVFVGVTSDNHWRRFCAAFQCPELFADARLATNAGRVDARASLIPLIAARLAALSKAEIVARCEEASIPYAPVAKTADLFVDPQLNAGGLVAATLPGGIAAKLPKLPIELNGMRPDLRFDAPRIGEHTREVLREAGLGDDEIAALAEDGVISVG